MEEGVQPELETDFGEVMHAIRTFEEWMAGRGTAATRRIEERNGNQVHAIRQNSAIAAYSSMMLH